MFAAVAARLLYGIRKKGHQRAWLQGLECWDDLNWIKISTLTGFGVLLLPQVYATATQAAAL